MCINFEIQLSRPSHLGSPFHQATKSGQTGYPSNMLDDSTHIEECNNCQRLKDDVFDEFWGAHHRSFVPLFLVSGTFALYRLSLSPALPYQLNLF